MTPERFQRLSRCWYHFPEKGKVAFLYEQFLRGLMTDFLPLSAEYNVRIAPVSLLPRDIAEREHEKLLDEQAEGRK